MSTPPRITAAIAAFVSVMDWTCEEFWTKHPAHLATLLDGYDAAMARWRMKVETGAPGDTATTKGNAMARLTKAEKARFEAEQQEFRRVEALAREQGFALHRQMALQPYCVRRGSAYKPVHEGTLADLEAWLTQP